MVEQKLGMKISDLADEQVAAVTLGSKALAVLKHDGKVYVLDGKCTHEGGPLGEGSIDNGELICPWHSGAYHIENGTADENTPWVTDIGSYRTRVDTQSGEIYVEL